MFIIWHPNSIFNIRNLLANCFRILELYELFCNDVRTKTLIILENVFAKLSCAHYLMDAKINHMMIESDDVSQ